VSETTKRVIALFQGHPELIEGYATFLPPGNTIQVPVDIQGNILVTTTTGTMEVARDGMVVNETHIQAPEDQRVERSSELAELDKLLLEKLQARIADSEEHKAKYEVFKASWEGYLKMTPEQRPVCGTGTQQTMSFTYPSQVFIRYRSGPRVRGAVQGSSRG
jgi:histone deacetylase complex regulatory component SIN3